MVILDIRLDNIYSFVNFELNFSYPKKIVNSLIPSEHLPGHPNFRYKKAVILMGTNASGKTTLGKALYHITAYLRTGNPAELMHLRGYDDRPGSFSIDLVNNKNCLERYEGIIDADGLSIRCYSAEIGEKDSYEKVKSRLKECVPPEGGIGVLPCRFAYPDIAGSVSTAGMDMEQLLTVLRAVLGTLDPSLQDISISKDLKKSFIIRRKGEEIIIQDGKLLNKEALSSGTIEGIDVALFLAEIMQGKGCFYYCDEHFSYIQSDIEKRIFGIMVEHLGDYDQLIFTTHNTDMLDLNLPKHAYAFLRKEPDNNGDYQISVVYASEFLKRNTDSIRCAAENNIFSSLPDDSLLDQLDREQQA